MWRGVGQNDSPFDKRVVSASLRVTPEIFTTVDVESGSVCNPVVALLLLNRLRLRLAH